MVTRRQCGKTIQYHLYTPVFTLWSNCQTQHTHTYKDEDEDKKTARIRG